MSNVTKQKVKGLVIELGTALALLLAGLSAAYGYGALNNRVTELEDKCKALVVIREDVASLKTMVTTLLDLTKETHK